MKKLRIIAIALLLFSAYAFLQYTGIVWYTTLFTLPYKTKGLDVSHHNKDIDWKKVAETGKYSFVFIKATEGHDFVDDEFEKNWRGAKENGLKVGAYHFFSMRSSGQEQAKYFMSTVPRQEGALPPVIDLEINLSHDKAKVQSELRDLSNTLETFYEQKPILYVTYDTYETYVSGSFTENPLWIRDIFKHPTVKGRDWQLWQYNNRGRVPGIPTYVDINVMKDDSLLSN
jgi:lysozyme